MVKYKSKIKNQKAITLIALVITIIVLLILAGVSIATLTGENGILTQATTAKEATTKGREEEQIKIAYNAVKMDKMSRGDKSDITASELTAELEKNGVKDVEVTGETKLKIKFIKTGNAYSIKNGKVEETNEVDWGTILADANTNPDNYKHEEQLSSEYIAIGTDGKPVNMDLWSPNKLEDGTFGIGEQYAYPYGYKQIYKGDCIDGRIQGTIPQYIYNEQLGEFKEVVSLCSTFREHEDLIYAPEIPSTVINMHNAFNGCTNLVEAPEIPNGVTNLGYTFENCTSLTEVTQIPSSVTNMESTFEGCINLTKVPEISSNVTSMRRTFAGCTSLIEVPEIPSSVAYMNSTFQGCTSLTKVHNIPNGITDLGYTFEGCINLIKAPEIPNSVIDMTMTFYGCTSLTEISEIPSSVVEMGYTFLGCTSLTGEIIINANPTFYMDCFYDTVKPIVLKTTGETSKTKLNSLAGTANKGNVKVE